MNPVSFFSNPWLNGVAWAGLLSVPPLIVALYFLKLKRQPLEVPSTYLWHRTIEDLHVNSLWQRLRQSILLFLQLLLIALVMLAVLRPSWRGATLVGDRFIFLVDTSASMTATDIEISRLEEAKKQILHLIEQMDSGDVAMIVSFSDNPRIEQQFTNNRRLLRRQVARIHATHRTSNLDGALRVVAGLANPGSTSGGDEQDRPTADALPATVYIFSDGNVPKVDNFQLGNLKPEYVPMGMPECQNVGIVAFNTQRNPEKPDRLQAFARLDHYGQRADGDAEMADLNVQVSLYLDGDLIDAKTDVQVPYRGTGGLEFDLQDLSAGTLRLEIERPDDLAVDNTAYATINMPRPAKVLLISPGNDALEMSMGTEQATKIGDVVFFGPEFLATAGYQKQAASAAYDLIIYDQCAPQEMPQSNTLFIGRVPPMKAWEVDKKITAPQIIDTDRAHPLMQFVEMGNVKWIAECTPLKPPAGGTILIDSDVGPIYAVAPREGFEDAVLGFSIVDTEKNEVNTDWPIRLSFPLFVNNALQYLGGNSGRTMEGGSTKPGGSVNLRTDAPAEALYVSTPAGEKLKVGRDKLGKFTFSETDQIGVYEVREGTGSKVTQRFAINLLDSNESNILPAADLKIEHAVVEGHASWEPTRREAWKYLLLIGLGILLLEWYIFNRRVYL